MSRSPGAFTLVEILVVVSIIIILMAMLVPITASVIKDSRRKAAKASMNTMEMALERYYNDLGDYPPDNTPGSDGNEALTHHLTTRFKIGERYVGPFMTSPAAQTRDGDGDGFFEFYSPMGGKYEYRRLQGMGGLSIYLLIDPGEDRNLGGTINPASGFVPDGSGAEKDNMHKHGQR